MLSGIAPSTLKVHPGFIMGGCKVRNAVIYKQDLKKSTGQRSSPTPCSSELRSGGVREVDLIFLNLEKIFWHSAYQSRFLCINASRNAAGICWSPICQWKWKWKCSANVFYGSAETVFQIAYCIWYQYCKTLSDIQFHVASVISAA